jgi:enoyl-CoA hydratase/carnithine racemase
VIDRDSGDLVTFDKQDGIAWITLNRPSALNAINLAMRDLLWDFLQAVRDDPDVRVLVLAGAGERAFSAGADVKEFGSAPSFLAARAARRERDVWGLLLSLPKPVIAAVHGFAYGAGCEMALCCDLRIAADDARFALPEVGLAYIPSAGGTQLLPRTIPLEPALKMILTGEPIDAAQALRIGLVNRLTSRGGLIDAARQTAESLQSRPAAALRYAKQAVTAGLDLSLAQGLKLEARLASLALQTGQRLER